MAVGLGFGCGGKDKKKDTTLSNTGGTDGKKTVKIDPTLCESKGKFVQTFDLNRDGRTDVWKMYDEGNRTTPTCEQADLDHDGDIDYEVATNRSNIREFEKFDFDFDGRFDAFTIFDPISGAIVETQRDSDFDGKYDLKEVYDDQGRISSIRRDMNADGDPDVWEQYVEGDLVAVLHDENFDGEVDRKEDIRAAKEPPPAQPTPDETTPDEATPDETTPDEATPDEATPDETAPDGGDESPEGEE